MNHGTRASYSDGCRCEPCTEANRIYSREYSRRKARAIREMLQPIAEGPHRHGTETSYMKGCRCTRCKTAAREARMHRRGGTKPEPVKPLPLQPLLERVSSYVGEPVDQLDVYVIARACGVSERTVQRWAKSQEVNSRDADDIAIRLGWHPAAIWGADWYIRTYNTGEVA